jgi:hypothetical protein
MSRPEPGTRIACYQSITKEAITHRVQSILILFAFVGLYGFVGHVTLESFLVMGVAVLSMSVPDARQIGMRRHLRETPGHLLRPS